MGVPAFYRWLVTKYPKVVEHAKQEKGEDVDITTPNPNGFEFDNLYLDMNGIIHPCFHPENQMFPPTTFAEVFEKIYEYIDNLVGIVRPRKLLYLAIDGVAPRAKLNQQRARRYKTAKDNEAAEETENRLREEFAKKGKKVLPKVQSQVEDSNVITPGTEFMYELAKALESYIRRKLENDPGWAELKVVLSDASVPGEGEHKIMSFIRSQRSLPGYDPCTRHCLYGLDADLIMLALATHELHFSILREDVLTVQEQTPVPESGLLSSIKNAEQHSLCKSNKSFFDVTREKRGLHNNPQRYQFLHVWILREYLELDMQMTDLPDKVVFDIERVVDDFIFICFFMGNDFLPHMPTLEIHENGIDLLMHVYKKEFKKLGGYLIDVQRVNDPHAGYIKLKRVERFILSVGSYEENIFKKRMELRDRKLKWISSELSESQEDELDNDASEVITESVHCQDNYNLLLSVKDDNAAMLENTKELKEKLKNYMRKKSDIFSNGNLGSDKVKLGSPGYKQRYYKVKFLVEDPKEVEIKRKEIVHKYAEGLCWVLLYYFSEIPSWDWYYSYHYGPFASDLKGLSQVKVKFQKGSPFKPFVQLMAVLPPRSAHALPKAYQELMLDSNSSIIEFYPNGFEVDVDGKRFMWQGICKLPFIDQEMLLEATKLCEEKIEEGEAKRNIASNDHLFMRGSNSVGGEILSNLQLRTEPVQSTEAQDGILCFNLELPIASLHLPRLLEGVQLPEKIVFQNDIMETMLWHEYRGNRPMSRFPGPDRHRGLSNNVWKEKTKQNFQCTGRQTISRVAANNVEKERTIQDIHKYPGPGRGWDSAGRGKGISCSSELRYNNVNPNQIGNRQPPTSVGTALSYRNAVTNTSAANAGRGMGNPGASHSDANGYNTRATHYAQNSFWPQRSGSVSLENSSWRPVSYAKPSEEEVPKFMAGRGRGRGRGHYRPNMDNRYSSQYSNHYRW